MSHFTVLVIGEDVEGQLAPFHEFECTGLNDEYVVEVDETNEVRDEWLGEDWSETYATLTEWLKEWHGKELLEWGAQPDFGVPGTDIQGRHMYGYAELDDTGELIRVVRRTNPNKKWDWYSIGGRWTGFFLLKPEVEHAEAVAIGQPGLMTDAADPADNVANSAMRGDIDFLAMRDAAGMKAGDLKTRCDEVTGGERIEAWESCRERFGDIDAARTFYRDQQPLKLLASCSYKDLRHMWEPEEIINATHDAWVNQARNDAATTFAVVRDGKWFERGEMGWWGMISDEKEEDTWRSEFAKLVDDLSPDTLLTVVDCHI